MTSTAVVPAGLDFDPVNDPPRRRHLMLALPWGSAVDPRHEDSGGHVIKRGDVLVDRGLARQGFVNVNHWPGTVGNIVDAIEDERGIWAVVDLTEDGERVLAEGNGDVSAEIIMPGLRWYFTGLALVSKDQMPAIPGSRVVFSNKQFRAFAVVGRPTNAEVEPMATPAATQAKPTPAAEAAESFDFEGFVTGLTDSMKDTQTKLVESLGQSVAESFSAGIKAALENITSPQDGPQPVRAARYTVTREAPIYSLNGAGPSLVRDGWYAAMHRDDDALDRLRKFRMQTEDLAKLTNAELRRQQFTTITTANASQVIPPGYRPDLFVPMLMQGRPMVAACSKGTLDNATPFVVPVFSSFSGATADHVEGVNPTDGSLTLTTKTVTPGAVSGRMVLTREIVDSSNPAIDQIALNAMRESYARQTEGKIYTLVNGANGAGGTITGDFVPSGAQAATYVGTTGTPPALIAGIRERLAKYPFNRFAAPQVGLMGQNATTILAKAADTTGRPIFPSIGAQNTAGLGNAVQQGWSVDGLPFVPAWAMTGVAAGDTQIAIINPLDLWAWESALLTFRYEEKSGPALIEFALFGYFATHLLRPVGLSGIRIT